MYLFLVVIYKQENLMSKINKALDYNKLLQSQTQGKLLKKVLKFPLLAQIKFDGNYTVTKVLKGRVTHYTSGGLTYTSSDKSSNVFRDVDDGYYIGERIARLGQLGDRRYCTLTGPKNDQKSRNHSYKLFDYLTIDEYTNGKSNIPYYKRKMFLDNCGIPSDSIVETTIINSLLDLEVHLSSIIKRGFEGLMLVNPDFMWEDTKSRKIDLCKYKKRPTVDLLCINTTEGEGKYEGLIGSLVLIDNTGRIVKVGAGLSDYDRNGLHSYFIGKVIEIEYEQIIDTYIQPTFIQVRDDKTKEEID